MKGANKIITRKDYLDKSERKEESKLHEENKYDVDSIQDDLYNSATNGKDHDKNELLLKSSDQKFVISHVRLIKFIEEKMKKFIRIKNTKLSLIQSQYQDELEEIVVSDKKPDWKSSLKLSNNKDLKEEVGIKENKDIDNSWISNKSIKEVKIENQMIKEKNFYKRNYSINKILIMCALTVILYVLFYFCNDFDYMIRDITEIIVYNSTSKILNRFQGTSIAKEDKRLITINKTDDNNSVVITVFDAV